MATSQTPGRSFTLTMSPTAKTSGCPGSVRSGSTETRPARSTSAPVASPSALASGEAWTPAAHSTVRAAMRPVVPSALATSAPPASMPVTRAPICSSTPRPSSSFVARPDRLSPNDASGSLPPSTRITRTDAGSNVRKFSLRLLTASSRIWPASSQPVGPAPTTTMVSHSACSVGVGRGLGHLERAEDAPADLHRIVDGLHPRGVQGELVVAEVRLAGAAGHDQAVVGDLHRGVRRTGGHDDPPLEVEAGDLHELDPHVLGPAQDVSQRWGDLTGRQDPRRHLVQQRLEQVVVAAIEQRHVDGKVGQEPACGEPAEPATDHDDAVPRLTVDGRDPTAPPQQLRSPAHGVTDPGWSA